MNKYIIFLIIYFLLFLNKIDDIDRFNIYNFIKNFNKELKQVKYSDSSKKQSFFLNFFLRPKAVKYIYFFMLIPFCKKGMLNRISHGD